MTEITSTYRVEIMRNRAMQLLLTIIIFIATQTSSFSQVITSDFPPTTVEWDSEIHNFGEINDSSISIHRFIFRNTGKVMAKIKTVKPSCTCSIANWTKEPVLPGETGFVEIEFNPKGQTGIVKKSFIVTMNTEPKMKALMIESTVIVTAVPNEELSNE